MVGKWPEGERWSLTQALLLHLADDVSRDGWVKVDGVVAETLRRFVALPTPALEGFAHPNLGSVAVLGMILDPVHILVSLFTAWHGASERLLVASVHAHGTEDGLGADGTLCGPRLITVRLLKVDILLITFTTCRRTAAEGRGRGDGWGDWRGEVSTGVARRSGNTAAAQTARQRQRQLGLHLLLQSLMFSPGSICHEPGIVG